MSMQFRNLRVGQSFDWINDASIHNSFFKQCTKVSNTTYRDEDGVLHSVGTTRAEVFHVDRPKRPYVSVVIKGNQEQAEWAASARNIPFTFSNGTAYGESVGYVPVEHLLAVMRWFGESGQAPFPVGTCLLFSHHEAKEDAVVEVEQEEGLLDAEVEAALAGGWEAEEAAANVAFRQEVDEVLAAEREARGDVINVGEFEQPVPSDAELAAHRAQFKPNLDEMIENGVREVGPLLDDCGVSPEKTGLKLGGTMRTVPIRTPRADDSARFSVEFRLLDDEMWHVWVDGTDTGHAASTLMSAAGFAAEFVGEVEG